MKGYSNLSSKLNRRITIEEVTETSDSAGGFTVSWATKAILWAMIKPISAIENFEANKIEGKVSHLIVVRYMNGITPKMRISYDGRVFDIKGVINVMEFGKILEIRVEERV